MRYIFISLLLVSRVWGSFTWCVPITFTNPTATTFTNYPAMFCANGATGAFCDSVAHSNLVLNILKTVGNGGAVTSTSGFDTVWYSDATCNATTVPFELVSGTYGATTGLGQWWVNITSFTGSGSVTLYMGVGNASITTDQSSTSTWVSNYKRVFHLEGVGTDSTSNAATASNVTSVTGKIQDGGSTATVSTIPNSGLPTGTSDKTIIGWFLVSPVPTTWQPSWIYGDVGTANASITMAFFATVAPGCLGSEQVFIRGLGSVFNPADQITATTTICINTWYHIAVTYTSSTNVAIIYLNGVNVASATRAAWSVAFGNASFSSSTKSTDEFRILDTVMSADNVAADYTNENTPWTFFNIGTPVPGGGGGGVTGTRRIISFN